MAPNFPHRFEQLRVGVRRPFLMAGAGLSWGLVPGPPALLAARKSSAEDELHCTTTVDASASLYKWAEEILTKLAARGEPAPKLKLAEALGLLSDARWTAEVGLPLRATTPRHRVLARFARENRLVSVWSFNWDTYIESALERVGFDRDEPRAVQPWATAYRTIVIGSDFVHLARDDIFPVLKPHGCARALLRAHELFNDGDVPGAVEISRRFMITESELTSPRANPTDTKFFHKLNASLVESPLMIVGWSISEPYLSAVINDAVKEVVQRGQPEELTIIDPAFNARGHTAAAACYDLPREQVFAELEIHPGGVGADEFFLWLQARYAVDHLIAHAADTTRAILAAKMAELERPIANHFLIGWTDDFLPAWTRLCWRAELVACAGYQPHQLRLELEDLHIPWNIPGLPRPDLRAAGNLLRLVPPDGGGWDFSLFPGGLWDKVTGRLILPLPAWGKPNELAALVPLLSVLKREIGFVTSLQIMALHYDPTAAPSADMIQYLKEAVAAMMPVNKFATADSISIAADLGSA